MPRVLIVGVSTRAAAESAVRAGYDVVAFDAYGDLDQPSEWHTLPAGVSWRTGRAARLARGIEADAVVYLSNFENDPRAVASLAMGRCLWGNVPEALRRARDPLAVRDAFRAAGIHAPDAMAGGAAPKDGDWLLKPLGSGGGARVRRWRGHHLPRGHYAQAFIEGHAGSVVFVAAGGRSVVLGTTRQLVGDARVRRERVPLLRQPAVRARERLDARAGERDCSAWPPPHSASWVWVAWTSSTTAA